MSANLSPVDVTFVFHFGLDLRQLASQVALSYLLAKESEMSVQSMLCDQDHLPKEFDGLFGFKGVALSVRNPTITPILRSQTLSSKLAKLEQEIDRLFEFSFPAAIEEDWSVVRETLSVGDLDERVYDYAARQFASVLAELYELIVESEFLED